MVRGFPRRPASPAEPSRFLFTSIVLMRSSSGRKACDTADCINAARSVEDAALGSVMVCGDEDDEGANTGLEGGAAEDACGFSLTTPLQALGHSRQWLAFGVSALPTMLMLRL